MLGESRVRGSAWFPLLVNPVHSFRSIRVRDIELWNRFRHNLGKFLKHGLGYCHRYVSVLSGITRGLSERLTVLILERVAANMSPVFQLDVAEGDVISLLQKFKALQEERIYAYNIFHQ